MSNPYMFPGVTPSHLKRRSESHSSSPLVASSTSFVSSKKRPSTSHASGHKDYAPSVASTATSSTVKVRYPYTVLKNGKKHHAFPTDIIPYPLNYDNRILDAFILDSTPIQSHSASNSSPLMATSGWKPSLVPTIHTSDPSTHPKRVLDLGCGTGAWCVAAAQVWPYTQFTGLDMVAIQSVPSSVGVERIEEVVRRVKEGKSVAKVSPGAPRGTSGVPTLLTPSRPSTSSSSSLRSGSGGLHALHPLTTTMTNASMTSTASIGSNGSSGSGGSASQMQTPTIAHPYKTARGPYSPTQETSQPLFSVRASANVAIESSTSLRTTSLSTAEEDSNGNAASASSVLLHQCSTPSPLSQAHSSSQPQPTLPAHARIKWVHHNFLSRRGLPFGTGEFDLVRVNGVAQGVPEDRWDHLLAELTRVLALGGSLEIIEEDILFPVVLAPKITFGLARVGPNGQPLNAALAARQAGKEHQQSLKSAHQNALSSLNELNRQTLFYSEEHRPSALGGGVSPSGGTSPGGMMSGGGGYSPLTPTESSTYSSSFYDSLGSAAGNAGGAGSSGYYGIPASYMQYVQTVPALARSLPPLALVNPFLHQHQAHFVHDGTIMGSKKGGDVTPFAQDHAVLEKLYTSVYSRRWINITPTNILAGSLGRQVELGGVVYSDCLEIHKPRGRVATVGESLEEEEGLEETLSARRRGSGGSQTLLEKEEDEEDGDTEEDVGDVPLSPPLTPTGEPRAARTGAYPPNMRRKKGGKSGSGTVAFPPKSTDAPMTGDSLVRKKSLSGKTRSRAKSTATQEVPTVDFKKHPTLALNASLHTMFPNLDNEVTRAVHLQRAWENVVACKEAMWEEFLHDSAMREKEANTSSSNAFPSSSSLGMGMGMAMAGGGSLVGAMGSLGGMGGMAAIGGMGGLTASMALPVAPFVVARRVPTLLDELEWADSDMRRSERERFDILLDRYEMRIRRHCAHAYENSGIPCLVARDRKGWANVEAGLDSSDEELLDDEAEPSSQSTPPLPNVGISSPVDSAPSDRGQVGGGHRELIAEEELSSSDEVTLAEPNSPRRSTSTAGRPSLASRLSPTSESPSHNLRVTLPTTASGGSSSSSSGGSGISPPLPTISPASLGTTGRLNPDGTPMINPSAVVAASLSRERARSGKQRKRSMSQREARTATSGEPEGPEELPSRILRAFIATKIQPPITV